MHIGETDPPQPDLCIRLSSEQAVRRRELMLVHLPFFSLDIDRDELALVLGLEMGKHIAFIDLIAATGEILWTFDTNREFETVNGVPANGGAIDGPGAAVAGGMLFVNSGYISLIGRPGNVLLAFGLD